MNMNLDTIEDKIMREKREEARRERKEKKKLNLFADEEGPQVSKAFIGEKQFKMMLNEPEALYKGTRIMGEPDTLISKANRDSIKLNDNSDKKQKKPQEPIPKKPEEKKGVFGKIYDSLPYMPWSAPPKKEEPSKKVQIAKEKKPKETIPIEKETKTKVQSKKSPEEALQAKEVVKIDLDMDIDRHKIFTSNIRGEHDHVHSHTVDPQARDHHDKSNPLVASHTLHTGSDPTIAREEPMFKIEQEPFSQSFFVNPDEIEIPPITSQAPEPATPKPLPVREVKEILNVPPQIIVPLINTSSEPIYQREVITLVTKREEYDFEIFHQLQKLGCNPESIYKMKRKFRISVEDVRRLMNNRFLEYREPQSEKNPVRKGSVIKKISVMKENMNKLFFRFGRVEMNKFHEYLARNRLVTTPSVKANFLTSFTETNKYFMNLQGQPGSLKRSVFGGSTLSSSMGDLEEKMEITPFEGEMVEEETMSALLAEFEEHIICAFAVSKTNHNLVIVGMDNGFVIELDLDKVEHKKYKMLAKVTAIGISPNDEYFVAGSAESEIAFRKTRGKMAKKKLKNLNGQRVVQIAFCDNSSVLVGTQFAVYFFKISSYALVLDVTMTSVMPTQDRAVVQVSSLFQGGFYRIAVCLSDRVLLFGAEKEEKEARVWKIGKEFTYPEESIPVDNRLVPMSNWYLSENQEEIYLVVFWRNTISFLNSDIQNYKVTQTKLVPCVILWGTVLDNKYISLISSKHTIEVLSTEKLFEDSEDSTSHFSIALDKGFMKDQKDEQFINKYKDKLDDSSLQAENKINYFVYFKNRVKDTGKEIFLITDKGLRRYRMIPFFKQILIFIKNKKYLTAIRLINNIVLRKVPFSNEDLETALEETPDLVKLYIEKVFGEDNNEQERMKALDICAQCLIYTANTAMLFSYLQRKVAPMIFWKEISRYIAEKKIVVLPLEELKEASSYLDTETVIDLLTAAELNLEKSEEKIFHILMIFKKKNLWFCFYKYCIEFPQQAVILFLSMLASEMLLIPKDTKKHILEEIEVASIQENGFDKYFDSGPSQTFFRIYWFLQTAMKQDALEDHFSFLVDHNVKVEASLNKVICQTLEWLLESNNCKMIIEECPLLFFHTFEILFSNDTILHSQTILDQLHNLRNLVDKRSELKPMTPNGSFSEKSTTNSSYSHQSASSTDSPWTMTEMVIVILSKVLDECYFQQISFFALSALINNTCMSRFDNWSFVTWMLGGAVSQPFKEKRFCWDLHWLSANEFEDVLIEVIEALVGVFMNNQIIGQEIGQKALNNK